VLLVNLRTYDNAVRDRIVGALERIVKGECEAAGSPRGPEFEYYEQYPLTSNDAAAVDSLRLAFEEHFGAARVETMQPVTASEDFSTIPEALGVPYVYWGLGGFLEGQETFPNHNP